MAKAATRLPLPSDFPEVVVHTTVAQRDGHPGYASAEAGDPDAALTLAIGLLEGAAIKTFRTHCGRTAFLLPVIADETTGFNAILDAMAQVLGRDLCLRYLMAFLSPDRATSARRTAPVKAIGFSVRQQFRGWYVFAEACRT